MAVRKRAHEHLPRRRHLGGFAEEAPRRHLARALLAIADHGHEKRRGIDAREVGELDAARLGVAREASRHVAENELRDRKPLFLGEGSKIESHPGAGGVAEKGDAAEVRLRRRIVGEFGQRLLDEARRLVRRIGRTGAADFLETRIEHEVAPARQVLDPAAVGLRIDRSPRRKEDDDRARLGRDARRVEHVGYGARASDRPLHHLRGDIVAAAGTRLRLPWRRRRKGRGRSRQRPAEEEESDTRTHHDRPEA